jgi:hypothetical protein
MDSINGSKLSQKFADNSAKALMRVMQKKPRSIGHNGVYEPFKAQNNQINAF